MSASFCPNGKPHALQNFAPCLTLSPHSEQTTTAIAITAWYGSNFEFHFHQKILHNKEAVDMTAKSAADVTPQFVAEVEGMAVHRFVE